MNEGAAFNPRSGAVEDDVNTPVAASPRSAPRVGTASEPFSNEPGWVQAGPGVYVNVVELDRQRRRDDYLRLEHNWEDTWV